MATYNALQGGKIILTKDMNINIHFSSSSIIYEFEQVKDRLTLFLREKLNNYTLTINATLDEAEAQNFIKSKAEIFKEMAERNPLLLKIKNELGLDYNSDE